MKDFPTKTNTAGGDDSGSSTTQGANEFNSLAVENETAVTSSGQTLTTGQAADTKTDQLARSLTITGQSAASYTDSGSADSYTLTKAVSTLVQPESYFDGMRVSFIPGNANTGASTINVSSLGAKAIRTVSDVAITAGVLLPTKRYDLVYISSYASSAGAFVINNDGADGAWQTPTLINGWAQTSHVLRFKLTDGGKYLRIIGSLTAASATNIIAFVLPSGWRPGAMPAGVSFFGTVFSAGTTDGPASIAIDDSWNVSFRLQSNLATYPTSTVTVNVFIEMVIPT